jgi:hypothetical protein
MTAPSIQAFEEQVSHWLLEALTERTYTFSDLLHRLPGVYPPVVLERLRDALHNGHIHADVAASIELQARTAIRTRLLDALPPPHPLDFEWRYTPKAARDIIGVAKEITRPDDRIVLLGTPGVAAAAASGSLDRTTIFVGVENVVTRALAQLSAQHKKIEVQHWGEPGLLPTGAGLVMVDPPWYFDCIKPMLAAAARSCRGGGFVLISLMPSGTRPGATEDRAAILAYVEELSLQVSDLRQNALSYDMPFFEANALAAAGIPGVPTGWRRSDLLVLKKIQAADEGPTFPKYETTWDEVSIGRMRVRIDRASHGEPADAPLLQSLVPGDVLPTVSRRDSRRAPANVWTSGNRIFRTRSPRLAFLAATQASSVLRDASSPNLSGLTQPEEDEVLRLSYSFLNLAEKEQLEESSGLIEEASCLSYDSTSPSTISSVMSERTVSG